MLCFPSPGIWTKKLTKDLNSDLEVKVQVQFQSCNLDYIEHSTKRNIEYSQ